MVCAGKSSRGMSTLHPVRTNRCFVANSTRRRVRPASSDRWDTGHLGRCVRSFGDGLRVPPEPDRRKNPRRRTLVSKTASFFDGMECAVPPDREGHGDHLSATLDIFVGEGGHKTGELWALISSLSTFHLSPFVFSCLRVALLFDTVGCAGRFFYEIFERQPSLHAQLHSAYAAKPMAAPGVGARASGCLGFLSTLFVLASFLPTGSGFVITSIGNFAQCSPTVITWDIGQSLPPFAISITVVSGLTDDGPLLFTGFEGTSATVTVNLPAKTRVNLALENSGGVLREVSNLVVQPGTESDCANSALSGSVPAVAATNADLPGLATETSADSSTSTDASTPIVTSSSPMQLTSTDHSSSPSATDSASSITPLSTSTLRSHKTSRTALSTTSTITSHFRPTPVPFSSSTFSFPTPSSVLPPSSSLSSETSGNGLQPGIIGAIVTCSVLGFALVLWLLFWCKRRRQHQRETRHTRLHSPEPGEGSARASVISVETVQGMRPPSIVARDPHSPTSVNATIGLPSTEAMMEHRNKPLPTPTTPLSKARTGFASSPGASSSLQPMTSPNFATPTSTSFAMAGNSRAFARRTQDLGRGLASDSVFDGSDASSDFTAPPPYDVYE